MTAAATTTATIATSEARCAPGQEPTETTLAITGMTCASCVRRVEKALAKVEGVTSAEVNLATERATVRSATPVAAGALRRAVEAAGYGADPVAPPQASTADRRARPDEPEEPDEPDSGDGHRGEDAACDAELTDLRRKWQVALTAGLGMMILMYLPLPIDAMDWVMPLLLVVATVVQFWAGRAFYRAAWTAARHRSTNMSTLVALGTSVAYGYSAFVTLWPGLAERWGLPLHVYFETSIIIIALILLAAGSRPGPRSRPRRRSGRWWASNPRRPESFATARRSTSR